MLENLGKTKQNGPGTTTGAALGAHRRSKMASVPFRRNWQTPGSTENCVSTTVGLSKKQFTIPMETG